MKRLLYILLCLPFWLACTDEHIPVSNHEVEEGTPVELRMSVALGEMNVASSRSFGYDISDYPTLWVVAFNKEGYLEEYAKAYKLEVTGNDKHETKFSVVLGATSEPRILHFIAFGKEEGENDYELNLEYGHESNVIGSLVVDGGRDVYWHRKVLNDGIKTDDTYIANNFQRIPLLRNFAKITVSENLGNFVLTGFYVLNVPTQGTVAPYSNGAFVDYMSNEEGKTEEAKTYEKLNEENYIGTMPDDVGYGQNGSSIDWVTVTEEEPGSFYMYENTYKGVENKTTSILIKGKFGGSTNPETYYRADLTLPNVATGLSEYYHILRNFHYQLNITSVIAAGKDNAQAAIEAPANNNLSGSVQVQNLSNISDGTVKLEVSYTEKVLVSTEPVTLKYRFLTLAGDTTKHSNDRVKIYPTETPNDNGEVVLNGKVIAKYKVATENERYKKNGTELTSSWRVITITPVGTLPASSQKQKITLYDEATKLRREVTYTLRSKLDMEVNCTPIVPQTAGSSVVVNICIPDDLNENLFPLDFAIEANTSAESTSLKQYISPAKTEVMSVTTGNSIVPSHTTKKSYQYIKELTYEEYLTLAVINKKRVFPVNFITNTAVSASTVYVDNKYFNQGWDNFINGTAHITTSEFTGAYYGVGQPVGLSFTPNASGSASIVSNLTPKEISSVTLNNGTAYTKNDFQTTTWSDRSMGVVTVTADESSYEYYLSAGPVRNILKMIVSSATLEGTAIESTTTMRVYRDEQSAKIFADSPIKNDALSAFNPDMTYTVDNLKENDTFWFAYMDADGIIHYTSTTAQELVTGANLIFKAEDVSVIPAKMTLTFGSGQNIYGSDKPVTLIFRTDKPGDYTLSSVNLNFVPASRVVSFDGTTLTVQNEDVNQDIIINCTTKNAGDALTATVNKPDEEGNSVTVTGETRTAPQLSNVDLSESASYYGVHDVTLTINVSAPCTVNIALNSGLSYNGTADLTKFECSAGANTVSLKTVGWNTEAKATVTLNVEGQTDQVKVVEETRNKLYIKAKSVQYGLSYYGNWYGQNVGNNSITISGTISGSVTGTNLTNGTAITVENLTEENYNQGTVTMTCEIRGWMGGTTTYSQSEIKLSELTGTRDIKLEEQ